MKMNINEPVWVKLTEHGFKVFDEHHRSIGLDPAPYRKGLEENKRADYYEFQMWELMHIFGSSTCMGFPNCFENEIHFTPPFR